MSKVRSAGAAQWSSAGAGFRPASIRLTTKRSSVLRELRAVFRSWKERSKFCAEHKNRAYIGEVWTALTADASARIPTM
ncbi:MAG: hypothetical protein LAP87_03990 [Acidobacteriia bacterium]|nr:hypothetical protein [Terriglobia bacterium]